ncbi:MAG: hypothetical protein R3D02_15975 [Hyphomicrobiales bacterium]
MRGSVRLEDKALKTAVGSRHDPTVPQVMSCRFNSGLRDAVPVRALAPRRCRPPFGLVRKCAGQLPEIQENRAFPLAFYALVINAADTSLNMF